MRRILVVNINWLGDAIFSTPLFRALKNTHPQAHVACLCVPRVEEALRHCPHIDEIIIYDEKGKDFWLWNKWRLVARLRRGKFDTAFLLHRSATRALLVYLAGIPRRIGYAKFGWLLTDRVQDPGDGIHRSDYYLKATEAYEVECSDRTCQLSLDEADVRSMDEKLKARGMGPAEKFIVFNTGGNWDLKRWPLSHWAALAKRVAQASKLKIIFSGAAKDRADVARVIEESGVAAVDCTGETTLGQSLALFARARAVVSGDSGPLHLAGSVGANTIGIFGPTRPEITGPRGTGGSVVLFKDVGCNKAPCYHLACGNNVCMQAIGVEDVWQALHKFTG